MATIIPGLQFGSYKTVGITLAQAKSPNAQGIVEQYMVLSIKDSYSMLSKSKHITIFGSEIPGAIEALRTIAEPSETDPSELVVNMGKFATSPELKTGFGGLLIFPGGMVVDYPLQKGLCYANDINGNRVILKDGQNVIRDSVRVFVQIKHATENADGTLNYAYVDGFALSERGSLIERQFFKEPVTSTTIEDSPEDIPEYSETPEVSAGPTQQSQQAQPQQRAQSAQQPW